MAQAATCCPPGLGRCRPVEHERFLHRKPQGTSRHVSRQGKAAIAASRQPTAGAGESVLIAGGGPAGLCAAMVLANRGYKGITVVEKRESPQDADPLRSFSYSIDERSQRLLRQLGLSEQLPEIGVETGKMYVQYVLPDGSVQRTSVMQKDKGMKNYWMPRNAFLQFLYDAVRERYGDSVTVLFDHAISSLSFAKSPEAEGKPLRATVVSRKTGEESVYEPQLVIGADGIHSSVRESLAQRYPRDFKVYKKWSPSSGLRYKTMRVPSKIPLGRDECNHADPTEAVVYRGIETRRRQRLRFASLPQRDPNSPRVMNFINFKDHYLWRCRTADEFYRFVGAVVPQADTGRVFWHEEVERFAASEPGRFPAPQASPSLSASFESASGRAGVVILGDAAHAFPPDLGQGVNAALEDVHCFASCLAENQDDLVRSVKRFNHVRAPDVHALVSLCCFSAPYQYNLEPRKAKLWQLNMLMRMQLHKWAPFMFDPPSFMQVQRALPYSEVLRRSNNTTRNIFATACGIIFVSSAFFSHTLGLLVEAVGGPFSG